MDFRRFVDVHRALWRRLEVLLDHVDAIGLGRVPSHEIRELARLYRKASADLLLAREAAGGADVVDYLEALVGRAYAVIHQPRRFSRQAVPTFLRTGFPALFQRERRYVATAGAILALGFAVAFVLTLARPEAFDSIVPAQIASFYGDEPGVDHRADRFGDMNDGQAASFSSMILVNNVRVTIKAFAFGLTAGVGTVAVLFQNGALLGAIAANFVRWERSLELWALVLPHGVIEFFAILLGAGGGLVLADALIRPGRRHRGDAVRTRGRVALALAAPAAPLLVLAALIEGYFTPMAAIPPEGKLLFAAATGVALVIYLRAPRAERVTDPRGA
jgi:uncharacterized membrane protein SpoIIM required for sporulation